MKTRHLFCAAASVLALCTAAPALSAPASRAIATASADLTVPPLGYQRRVLANGMEIYTRPDDGTANVAVQVWYRVGGKDDPSGRSGFAHLFEHLLFKATENVPNETFDRLTEDVGGYNNAFTADDVTAYHEVVPANHLERILFAEADRMSSLVVDEEVFISERDVVKEEYRQSVLSNPYGRLFYLFTPSTFYTEHPYRRGVIGSIGELEASSLEDVLRFHRTYYRPDNAFLIVDGNFDEAQLNAWVDQYFGVLKNPDFAIPTHNVAEPALSGPKDVSIFAPNVPLPAVQIGWHTVPYNHADRPALTVLDGILSTGESSRLYRSLTYEHQVAAEAASSAEFNQQAGHLTAFAILSQGRSIDEGKQLLEIEIDRLRDAKVTPEELDEAKNELVAAALRSREGSAGRAQVLGMALINTNDPTSADNEVALLQAVTAEDIQRVARHYLTPQRQITMRYQQADDANPVTEQVTNMDAPVKVADLAPMGVAARLKPEADRTPIPAPGAEVALATPPVADFTMPNGLRVLVVNKDSLPLISARLTIKAGAAQANKAGVDGLTAAMLSQGTTTRTAPQIATQTEQLGADISAGSGYDTTTISASSPANVFAQTLELMADMVRNPAFAQDELERQRTQTLDGLALSMGQPGAVASMAANRINFGNSPYGSVATEASVRAIETGDLKAFHNAHFRPDEAILTFAGDITEDQARALAQQAFGDWSKGGAQTEDHSDVAGTPAAPRIVIINLPGSGQAAVSISQRSVDRTDDAYLPLTLGNTLLGGSYSSRLNQEIRINRGLSYGARSSIGARADAGLFTASTQTKNESALEVADLLLAELARMGTTTAGEPEVAARRAIMTGEFGRSLESVSSLGALVAGLAAYDIPMSELADYAGNVRALSPEQVQAAFANKLPVDRANVVVVGDASLFLDGFKAKYPQVEVIEASDLNLDKASLR